ncbi:MAG: hypothetical protein OWU33_16790 [Firmicutes bacterium]|nr:hypothetical protein [Bacillota bacterium]
MRATSRRYTKKYPYQPFEACRHKRYWHKIENAIADIEVDQRAGYTSDPFVQLVEITYYDDGTVEYQVLAECEPGPVWSAPLVAMGLQDRSIIFR